MERHYRSGTLRRLDPAAKMPIDRDERAAEDILARAKLTLRETGIHSPRA
jgi:hypothetical protein